MAVRAKPRWQAALEAGKPRTALVLWLCHRFGYWRTWIGTSDEVRDRLWAEAYWFVVAHNLPVDWCAREASPVRRAWRYVYEWVCCLAHRRFHKGKRWVDATPGERARWRVGWGRAQEVLMDAQERSRYGAAVTNMRKAGARAMAVAQAHDHRREGMCVTEIAEVMEVTPRAVYDYLRQPDPANFK